MTTRDNAIAELHFGEKHIRLNNLNPWSNSKHKGVKMNIEEAVKLIEKWISTSVKGVDLDVSNAIELLFEFAKQHQWQRANVPHKHEFYLLYNRIVKRGFVCVGDRTQKDDSWQELGYTNVLKLPELPPL